MVAAAIAIASSGAGAASAQAATLSRPHLHAVEATAPATAKPAVQPDFTCNTPGVCFFDGADFTGAATNYIPSLEPDR
jgi:hypothetical protein